MLRRRSDERPAPCGARRHGRARPPRTPSPQVCRPFHVPRRRVPGPSRRAEGQRVRPDRRRRFRGVSEARPPGGPRHRSVGTMLRLVSCDDHMDISVLPPDVWTARLPARLRDAGPRVRDTAEGRFWMVGDAPVWRSGGVDARLPNAIVRAGLPDDGYRASDPRLRLADMDRDGIEASVIYGPITGLTPAAMRDVELRHACYRAYNDWAAEFNASDPRRLCLLAMLPADDPGAAAAEVERVAALGHRGVQLGHFEAATPIHDRAWEPLWAASASTGLPLSFHLIGGTYLLHIRPGSWEMAAFAAVAPMQLDEVLAAVV